MKRVPVDEAAMFDLVVVGGGVGGLSVALQAAGVGASVALIERLCLGGQRSQSASVPGKVLLRAAKAINEVRRAATFGVRVGPTTIDFAAVLQRVHHLVAHETEAARTALLKSQITLFQGSATFEAYDTVLVDGRTRVEGRRFVIATGSRPAIPRITGLVEARYRDVSSIWSMTSLPGSLIVLGDDANALEFPQAFARLGTRTQIVTENDRLLPAEAPEISRRITEALAAEGIAIVTRARIEQAFTRDGLRGLSYRHEAETGLVEIAAEELLVSCGRLANVSELNLNAVGIEADPVTGIPVDEFLQTRAPSIYALGDVLGHHHSRTAAEREADVVFHNAVLRLPKKIDYGAVPRVVYTDPEIASVGVSDLAEGNAERGFHAWSVELSGLDRALIDGVTTGCARAVTDRSGRILGATVMAPEASSLITELVLAMDQHIPLADLAGSVHPEPSYASLVAALADQCRAARDQASVTRRLAKWYHGL